MKLKIGQILDFKGYSYELRAQLGSGAVSDVYLAVLVGAEPPAEVAIKIVHEQAGPESRQAEGARAEAEVLTILNRTEDRLWASQTNPIARLNYAQKNPETRRIIGLLDSGPDDDGRIVQIQELAPPAFRRLTLQGIEQERALIGVAEAVARAIAHAHVQGFALKDFEPRGEKVDRIRVDWNAPKQVKIIDWNITAGPDATADEKASDLLYLGGHLFYFFSGEQVELTGRAPDDLSIPGWNMLHEGSRQIVRQLLNQRYRSAREVRDDLSWWLATLALRNTGEFERRVRLAGERHDRKLAVADLALRLELGPAEREHFTQIAEQARRDLARANRVQLEQGFVNLRTGLYQKAVQEFERNLRDPQLPPELAQQARLYQLQAQFAIWLRDQAPGRNISRNPAWQLVNRAVEDIQRQQWQSALDALRDAAEKLKGPPADNPLWQIQAQAGAGLIVGQYAEQQRLLRGAPQSLAVLAQWLSDERAHLATLERTVEQLRYGAYELAPHEPFYATFYQNAQAQLEKRKQQLAEYTLLADYLRDASEHRQQADDLLKQPAPAPSAHTSELLITYRLAEAALADARAAAIRAETYAADTTAQPQLLPDIETQIDELHAICTSLAQLPTVTRLIQAGEYDQALDQCNQASATLIGYNPLRVLRASAQTGVEWQSRAQTYVDQAREAIRQRALDLATERLEQTLALDAQPLVAAADRATFPNFAAHLVFQLHSQGDVQRLLQVIRTIRQVRQRVLRDYTRNHEEIADELEGLRRDIAAFGYGLNDDEATRLEQARQGQQRIQHALASLAHARGRLGEDAPTRATALRNTIEHLGSDPTPRAQELRETAAEEWLRLCMNEREFDLMYQLLGEGVRLMSGTTHAKQLRELYEYAAPAAYVSACLPADAPVLPAWLGQADRAKTLTELEPNLRQLSASIDQSSLVALRQTLPRWNDQLKAGLAVWLNEVLDRASELADKHEFAAALEQLREAQKTGLETLQRLVPVPSASLEHFIAALEQRQQLEQDLARLVDQLAKETLAFGDAPQHLPQFPQEHPHVSLIDLRAFAANLTQLAKLSGTSSPAAIDAQWLHKLYNRHDDIAQLEQQVNVFAPDEKLNKPIARLQEATWRQALADAQRLSDQLASYTELDQVQQHAFGQLFWTLAWWQAATAERDPDASALAASSLSQARSALYALAKRTYDDLLRAASMADIEHIERALAQVRDYNRLFASPPADLLLPDNIAPAKQAPPFDENLLADWRALVEGFARVGRAQLPDSAPKQYSAILLEDTSLALQHFIRQLQQFGETVWPALFPGEPRASARLETLERGSSELLHWANVVHQAHAHFAQANPLDTLQQIYQGQAEASLDTETWPLDCPRASILRSHRAIEQLAVEALVQQVQAILENNNTAQAAEQLRAELLEHATNSQLATSLEHAIVRTIQQLNAAPSTAKPEENYRQRRHRWQIVMDAIESWRRSGEPVLA